jgi:FkbM family methyltransferase
MDFRKLLDLISNPKYWPALRHGVAATVEHAGPLRDVSPATVIDVGANKGQFSLFSSVQWPNAEIISFEPIPSQADKFEKVLGQRAQLHRLGLGSATSTLSLHLASRTDSSSFLPLSENQKQIFRMEETGSIDVPVRRLDDVLAPSDIQSPALLKIDVQGFEYQVIEGMIGIRDCVKWIYVEASFVELYQGQVLHDDLVNHIRTLGYEHLSSSNLSSDLSGNPIQADLLFISNQV